MKALTALLTLAGAAGIGYLAYKKTTENKEKTSAYTEYKEETKKDGKLHRASMYAVGTIKTTADKISEGIKQVMSEDMVKIGEETMEMIRSSGESFKEQAQTSTENLYDHIKEYSESAKEESEETSESIKDDLNEIKDLVTSINVAPAEIGISEIDKENDIDISDVDIESLDDDESSLFEKLDDVDDTNQL